jgi:hypothetical protein
VAGPHKSNQPNTSSLLLNTTFTTFRSHFIIPFFDWQPRRLALARSLSAASIRDSSFESPIVYPGPGLVNQGTETKTGKQ